MARNLLIAAFVSTFEFEAGDDDETVDGVDVGVRGIPAFFFFSKRPTTSDIKTTAPMMKGAVFQNGTGFVTIREHLGQIEGTTETGVRQLGHRYIRMRC